MKNFKKYFVLSAICLFLAPLCQEMYAQEEDVDIEEEGETPTKEVTPVATPTAGTPATVTATPTTVTPKAPEDDVDIEDVEEKKPEQPPTGAPIKPPAAQAQPPAQAPGVAQKQPVAQAPGAKAPVPTTKPAVPRSFLDPLQTQLAQRAAASKIKLAEWLKQRRAPAVKVRSAAPRIAPASKGKEVFTAARTVAGRVIPTHRQVTTVATPSQPLPAAQKQAQLRAQQRAQLLQTRRVKFAQPKRAAKPPVKRPVIKRAKPTAPAKIAVPTAITKPAAPTVPTPTVAAAIQAPPAASVTPTVAPQPVPVPAAPDVQAPEPAAIQEPAAEEAE